MNDVLRALLRRDPAPLRRRSARPRRTLTLLLASALAMTAVVLPSPVLAAPNPGIVVSDVVITHGEGGPATVGDVLTVEGSWDASAADPTPGDTFTIGLPPELGFEQPVPFQLFGGDGVVWGNCLTDPATSIATCTLTDAVATAPEQVLGTFLFEVEAVLVTTEEEVTFDLNGVMTAVDLPGTGGIDDGITVPDTWTKSGVLSSDKWSMTWTIDLPGSRLAGHDVVNVLDDLGDNHVLCADPELTVKTVRGSTVVDVSGLGAIDADVAAPHDFGIVLTAPEAGFDRNVTYRVTYRTCTPDGQIDPRGTEYTNQATVDVWGESSGVIGVTQDWEFTAGVDKSGSVLGGTNRDGLIQWTVTVSGDELVGKQDFTFSDQLTGEHALCTDSSGSPVVRGLSIEERYGPTNQVSRTIGTDLLARTTTSATATSFAVDFDVVGGSDFAFRPLDHLYLIRYQTCATTDGLPESGTAFGNTASVDGTIDAGQAVVPGRSEGKGGNISSAPVTVDGVTYLPQTTLGWNITVPGQELAAIEGDLTITDEIVGTHQVCGTGDDIASRLGLRIEARDQIQNGGLATVDLTDSAQVELDGTTVTITLPEPTLAQPGGGSATGFSREYQYVVRYLTCTTSGGMDAPGTTYSNSATVAGKSYTSSITQQNRGSGTGQGVTRGSIAVAKDLADTASAAFVPDDTVFTVHVREIDPTGTPQIEYDLAVPLDGGPVSGPNARGTGWTAELSEPTMPSVPGVTFGAPSFTATPGVTVSADGTTAVASLAPGTNVEVGLTNTALLGQVEITKSLEGPAASQVAADRTYPVTAKIDTSALGAGFPAQPDRLVDVKTGVPVVLTDLPIGATVTFSETLPLDDDVFTWSPAVISPESLQVQPAHATTPAAVSVTNRVERTVGTFAVSKSVSGAQAANPAVPDDVTVTARWDDAGTPRSKVLTVPTDGTPVALGENLLIGTEVTLTETALTDGSSIAWAAPQWSGPGVAVEGTSAVVTIGRTADAVVQIDNHAATSTAGLSLVKRVSGEAAGEVDPSTRFPVTVTWTDAAGDPQERTLTIGTTEPTELGEVLPAGTVVTVTEGTRPEQPTVIWDSVVISGTGVTDAGDGSATVVVSDQQDDVSLVTVVNEATWAPGTFSLAKQVEGVRLDHTDVPDLVTVVASWVDENDQPQSTELELPTDGTEVAFGADLPHGTEVLLTELAPDDSVSFTWNLPQWSGTGLVARPDGTAVLTIGAATAPKVDLLNEVTPVLADLAVTKRLTGDGASALPTGSTFPVTASWTDVLGTDHEVELQVPAGGTVVVPGVPVGVPVTLVEREVDLPDRVLWSGVAWAAGDDRVEVDGTTDRVRSVVTVGSPSVSAADVVLTNDLDAVPHLPGTGAGLGLRDAGGLALLALLALASGLVVMRRSARLED